MVVVESERKLVLAKIRDRMVIVFRLCGMWPSEEWTIVYLMYSILLLSVFSMLFSLSMIIQLIAFSERDELTENSYMTLTEFALSVKIINFCFRSRYMKSHMDTVMNFKLHSDEERQHFLKRLKFSLNFLMFDFALTNTAHLTLQMKALSSAERMLAFPAWHPINWSENDTNYWSIFAYQLMAMHITCNIQVVIQEYPNFMFYMVSTQMEVLSMRLRNIGYKKVVVDKGIEFERMNTTVNQLFPKEIVDISYTLKDCIKVHHETLE